MEEGFDSTLALVDHLEIEISDREGGEEKSESGLDAAGMSIIKAATCTYIHTYMYIHVHVHTDNVHTCVHVQYSYPYT